MAILVNKTVLLEKILPAPGLIKPIFEVPIVDTDLIKVSVTFNITFFLFKFLYFFYNIHYQF